MTTELKKAENDAATAPELALPSSAPSALLANASVLDAAEIALSRVLLACRQQHLFANWAPPGVDDAKKHQFFDQVAALDAQSYTTCAYSLQWKREEEKISRLYLSVAKPLATKTVA